MGYEQAYERVVERFEASEAYRAARQAIREAGLELARIAAAEAGTEDEAIELQAEMSAGSEDEVMSGISWLWDRYEVPLRASEAGEARDMGPSQLG